METKEIGGYLELERFGDSDIYEEYHHLNLGRTALVCLLEALGSKKILLPYFLCDSVVSEFQKTGCSIRSYHVSSDLRPVEGTLPDEDEYMLLVNYYGQLTNEEISVCKKRYERVIVDNTHAYFQRPVEKVPTVYSCRKFFGLPDGAILAYDGELPKMEADRSSGRFAHLLGRVEDGASAHYEEMLQTAKTFYDSRPMHMSALTRNLLNGIDYDRAALVRAENYERLDALLKEFNGRAFSRPDAPFCYPFYVKNGIEARKRLAKQRIYVPTYWNNVLEEMDPQSVEYDLAANILPLPCDQRYGDEDMDAVAKAVKAIVCGE